MQIIHELKRIAAANAKRDYWIKQLELSGKVEMDDLHIESAYLIDGCKEKNGHLYQNGWCLDNSGLVDDQYYCYQTQGYHEDDFYGTLYFKTNVPGQFVQVPFHM
jgi:hypothetical protein